MSDVYPGQFRLSRVQLINWGTFSGYVDMPIARRGHLITGGSGSGKSTLLDAMSSILVPPVKVHFNEAAQQGLRREQGRTLASYIRGAWRRRENAETGGIASTFLRSKATYSVVGLTYDNAKGTVFTLVGLFYLRAGDTANAQVQKFYGMIPASVDVREFEQFLKAGVDKRKIKSTFADGRFSDQYRVFADYFRPRLGMRSEEAQLLLHRTQSAKSLTSLDQLFRDYMLEPPTTFAMAEEAVEQFDDLRQAYHRVVDVRAQIDTLQPLVGLRDQRSNAEVSKAHALEMKRAFPAVRDSLHLAGNRDHLAELTTEVTAADSHVAQLQEALDQAQKQVTSATAALQAQGDGRLGVLAEQESRAREKRAWRLENRTKVHNAVQSVGGAMPTDAEGYAQLLVQVQEIESNSPEQISLWEAEQISDEVDRRGLKKQSEELAAELSSLSQRSSNIDRRYIHVRKQLAESLQVTEQELPFAGELIDVRHDQRRWEPVVQRLLGSFATTLLVPERLARTINSYVNRTSLGIRLTYRVIPSNIVPSRRSGSPRALSNKLGFLEAPMSTWVRNEILRVYDYECVDNEQELEALGAHQQGATIKGLVRERTHKDGPVGYVKDDRRRLGDLSSYRLGTSNDEKVELLREEISRLNSKITATENRIKEKKRLIDREREMIDCAEKIAQFTFDQIDIRVDDASLEALAKQRADILTSPELAQLQQLVNEAENRYAEVNSSYRAADRKAAQLAGEITTVNQDVARLESELANREKVEDATYAELSSLIGEITRRVTQRNIDQMTEKIIGKLDATISSSETAITQANSRITRILTQYISEWPAEKSELRDDPSFAGEAINRLTFLRRDRLGDFEGRFLDLMNESSVKNLGALSTALRRARGDIETRLQPVNESLGDSEFNAGRWLKVEVRDNRNADALKFMNDLTEATSGAMAATRDRDIKEAEKRYQALSIILDRLGSDNAEDQRWRRLVLDTRLHVRFIASEIDATGVVLNTYVDSASLSGGQAQKLVFFCLAAALRFRLAEADEAHPRYATVVLDEAFDRADPAFTRTAMNIFSEFGFHMVLATPLKLVQTLSPYVDGTVVINYSEGVDDKGNDVARSGWAHIDSSAEGTQ
ncbi:ATP-binding protein [Corynebacterium flavescens]|uniref:ATP-binding protein n=1 Tax=Corynebacterium flavescens TaxID=28028 RepID=UPI003FD369FD